jgi:hypothetical protein
VSRAERQEGHGHRQDDAARVQRVATSGTFSLGRETFGVDDDVWFVGHDEEVLIVDAAHDAPAIHRAVAARRVTAIVCAHALDDRIDVAAERPHVPTL